MKINNRISIPIVLTVFVFVICSGVFAKMFARTYVASGKIAVIRDNIITLDDGYSYYPGIKNQQVSVKAGQAVSIRYVIDSKGNRIYAEVKNGINSLKEITLPPDAEKPRQKV